MRRSLLVSAAIAATAVFALAAYGASGSIGNYQPITATCFPDYILVSSPAMEASPVALSSDVFIIGPSHVQWVAFRPHLAVWNSATGWEDYAAGSWKAQKVGDNSAFISNSYFDLDTQSWVGGGTRFNTRPGYYYRPWAEYYWYADNQANSGYDWSWTGYMYDYRTLDQASKEWCQY